MGVTELTAETEDDLGPASGRVNVSAGLGVDDLEAVLTEPLGYL